jgi:hypothetical protein
MGWQNLWVLSDQLGSLDSNYATHVNRSVMKFVGAHPNETQLPQVWRSCFDARIWSTYEDAKAEQDYWAAKGLTYYIHVFSVKRP